LNNRAKIEVIILLAIAGLTALNFILLEKNEEITFRNKAIISDYNNLDKYCLYREISEKTVLDFCKNYKEKTISDSAVRQIFLNLRKSLMPYPGFGEKFIIEDIAEFNISTRCSSSKMLCSNYTSLTQN
jgi:hypothetical protein